MDDAERSAFPLFPLLSDEGKREAGLVIERFKKEFKRVAEEILGQVYIDVPDYIESDSWTNFRNSLMDGFRDYGNRKVQADYDFKQIRAKIYSEFRDEIIKDLDQDNLATIEQLKKDLAHWKELYSQSSRSYG